MRESDNLGHHFLVAMPTLQDVNFSKAVVYLAEHSDEGAMGFIINKPLHVNLGTVLSHLDIKVEDQSAADLPVIMGGPVGQENGFVIHDYNAAQKRGGLTTTVPAELEDEEIDVVITASREILQDIAVGKGPSDFLVTLGYAGWEPGQLEEEINRNDWLIVPFSKDVLFKVPAEQRWAAAAQLLGVDINSLSGQMGHA